MYKFWTLMHRSNEYLLAKIDVYTAEKEPINVTNRFLYFDIPQFSCLKFQNYMLRCYTKSGQSCCPCTPLSLASSSRGAKPAAALRDQRCRRSTSARFESSRIGPPSIGMQLSQRKCIFREIRQILKNVCNFLEGSFSAVSKLMFASRIFYFQLSCFWTVENLAGTTKNQKTHQIV